MTKNNDITNNHIVNILNQNITIPIAIGITKESQKLSLNSTKINIKHTKGTSVFNQPEIAEDISALNDTHINSSC